MAVGSRDHHEPSIKHLSCLIIRSPKARWKPCLENSVRVKPSGFFLSFPFVGYSGVCIAIRKCGLLIDERTYKRDDNESLGLDESVRDSRASSTTKI